jgi:hypothetical protein
MMLDKSLSPWSDTRGVKSLNYFPSGKSLFIIHLNDDHLQQSVDNLQGNSNKDRTHLCLFTVVHNYNPVVNYHIK